MSRYASAVILEIAYGHKVESEDDGFLKLSEQIKDVMAGVGSTGVSTIDLLPVCALRYESGWNRLTDSHSFNSEIFTKLVSRREVATPL